MRSTPAVEQCPLGAQHLGDQRVFLILDKLLRKLDLGRLVQFGEQPRFLGQGNAVLVARHLDIGVRTERIEPNQNLPLPHPVTFLDENLLDDSALVVLHDLPLGVDAQLADCDHGAGERGHRCPSSETPEEEEHEPIAEQTSTLPRRLDSGFDFFVGGINDRKRLCHCCHPPACLPIDLTFGAGTARGAAPVNSGSSSSRGATR